MGFKEIAGATGVGGITGTGGVVGVISLSFVATCCCYCEEDNQHGHYTSDGCFFSYLLFFIV
jgi:hypothetical protein